MMKGVGRVVAVLALVGFLPLYGGCGQGHRVERLPVHGTVTMASGERLNGSITFIPARGQSGPSATTKLDEGQYEFDRTNGPTAGPHTVIIKRVVHRSDSLKAIVARKRIQNNRAEWTLTADVVDDGHYLQDLTIDQ